MDVNGCQWQVRLRKHHPDSHISSDQYPGAPCGYNDGDVCTVERIEGANLETDWHSLSRSLATKSMKRLRFAYVLPRFSRDFCPGIAEELCFQASSSHPRSSRTSGSRFAPLCP